MTHESIYELFDQRWLHADYQLTEAQWHKLSLEARSAFFAMKVLGWMEAHYTEDCPGSEPGARFNGDGYDITFAYLHPPHLRDDVDNDHPDSLDEWLSEDYARLYEIPEFASSFDLIMPLLEQFKNLNPLIYRGSPLFVSVDGTANQNNVPWEWTVKFDATDPHDAARYAGCCDFQYLPSAICAALLKAHGYMKPEYWSP